MFEATIGRVNTLTTLKHGDSGALLDGGGLGEILLPKSQVPLDLQPDQEIEVFIFNDSEDQVIATTKRPVAMADQFARLRVVATTQIGAFLDWGLPKDLLLPFREQIRRVNVGDHPLVHIHLDRVTNRLVASMKIDKHLAATGPSNLLDGTEVSLLIATRSDLGVNAIVDDQYWGLLHASTPNLPNLGERCTGYVGRVREDGLVDLTLDPPGYKRVSGAAEQLAEALDAAEDGFLPLHDKSSPEDIRTQLGMSKKVFKQALGALYRARLVRIEADGIHKS